MTGVEQVVEALRLPHSSLVGTRISKQLIATKGTNSAGDRRIVSEVLDAVTWVAQLKPQNVGIPVPAGSDPIAAEVGVVTLASRAEGRRMERAVEILHTAIPYPVLMVIAENDSTWLSAASKRHSRSEAGAVVLDDTPATSCVPKNGAAMDEALELLDMSNRSFKDLQTLYDHWTAIVVGLRSAPLVGSFGVAESGKSPWDRWAQVQECESMQLEIEALSTRAKNATQMAERAELNGQISKQRIALQHAIEELRGA